MDNIDIKINKLLLIESLVYKIKLNNGKIHLHFPLYSICDKYYISSDEIIKKCKSNEKLLRWLISLKNFRDFLYYIIDVEEVNNDLINNFSNLLNHYIKNINEININYPQLKIKYVNCNQNILYLINVINIIKINKFLINKIIISISSCAFNFDYMYIYNDTYNITLREIYYLYFLKHNLIVQIYNFTEEEKKRIYYTYYLVKYKKELNYSNTSETKLDLFKDLNYEKDIELSEYELKLVETPIQNIDDIIYNIY